MVKGGGAFGSMGPAIPPPPPPPPRLFLLSRLSNPKSTKSDASVGSSS